MSSDVAPKSWIDADETGLKRVNQVSGHTIEVVREDKAPWSELPSLAIKARFDDLTARFLLDRQGNLREVGSRQERVLAVYERLRYSQMAISVAGGPEIAASALDNAAWLRLEASLMDALVFWPGIRSTDALRREGVKGALGAFERIWDVSP